jgi:DNA polymerase-3 subunit delta
VHAKSPTESALIWASISPKRQVADVIVKSAESDRFLDRLPEKITAVLLFGPDQGLVTERAERLMRTLVEDIRDAFRVSEIDGARLLEDKALLSAEAAALSFSGGRRVVRVRAAGNAVAPIFESFFDASAGEALIVVEAGDFARSSNLRQLFEKAPNAAAVACYLDSPDTIAEILESTLREQRIRISPDAMLEAVALLGSDRGTTRRQIEKLVLYADKTRPLEVSDVRAVIGDESEARIEEVCDAAGEGKPGLLDRALERLWAAGMSPVAVLRVAIGHFHRLGILRTAMSGGESAEGALRRLKPAVHFARTASFRNQLRNWDMDKLGEALDVLLGAEALCKSTAMPAEAACGHALLNIAAMARLPA